MPKTVRAPKLLYQVIKESIMQTYVTPLLREGGPIPSDRKLAAEYEVNVGTINKAIHELAREGLVERRVGSGTKVIPQQIVKPAVGIYFGDLVLDGSRQNAIYGKLDHALQELIAAADRSVRHYVDMRIAAFQGEPLPELMDDIRSSRLTSLVVARASYAEYEWLSRLPVPVVGNSVNFGGTSVHYDMRDAAKRATKHLVSAGCERIALVCPTPPGGSHTDSPLWLGVNDALAGTGLEGTAIRADTSVKPSSPGERIPDEQRGRAAFERLWEADERPDGVVVFTDVMAVGVIQAASEMGVAVGSDVRVVPFTNAEHLWPELESLPQMQLSMKKVAKALLDLAERLERGEVAGDENVKLTFRDGSKTRTRRR